MSSNLKAKKSSFRGQLKKAGQNPLLKIGEYSAHLINPQGKECRLIQKRHLCFCGHQFDSHVYHESHTLHCASLGCDCKSFQYIPDITIKCLCKHSNLAHTKQGHKCQKCQNCLGFSTDLFCKCGYRFMQHNNHVNLKEGKENNKISIQDVKKNPLVCKNSYDYLPKGEDGIVEKLSKSMIKANIIEKESIDYAEKLQHSEYYMEEYLKEKLKQANRRYFANFTQKQQKQVQRQHQTTSAFDLFMQPHMYRNVSLTRFIKQTLHQ